MGSKYDRDLESHRNLVCVYLHKIADIIKERGCLHDESKTRFPEREQFEKLSQVDRDSFEEYEKYLAIITPLLGSALEHHYSKNRHHPEHFENGIDDMTLVDIIEMIYDWKSSTTGRGTEFDLDYLFNRFRITPQLQKIIKNTLDTF